MRVPTPQAPDQRPIELVSKDDFQLSQAIAFLKGEPVKQQSPTVAQSPTKPAATKTD